MALLILNVTRRQQSSATCHLHVAGNFYVFLFNKERFIKVITLTNKEVKLEAETISRTRKKIDVRKVKKDRLILYNSFMLLSRKGLLKFLQSSLFLNNQGVVEFDLVN